ncbi:MAG: AmmeMemoRadiSam system protein B [Polyangiaceae bacterium]
MATPARPRLRPVETIVVPDKEHGKILILRDTEGIATSSAQIPPALVPIVGRFEGRLTCAEIAREASVVLGEEVPVSLVEKIARELDEALLLEGATFRAARAKVETAFASASTRTASHAGGAYFADPKKLEAYLDEKCLAFGDAKHSKGKTITALIAPHIDPWRGAVDYGHGYAALAAALSPEADTFVLFGTSHAPMREPFALCNKAFDTPFGALDADQDALAAIAAHAKFDPYADQLLHKREHSLEFQVVFLKHVLAHQKKRNKPAKIVPILASLGEHQARGTSPERDKTATAFLDGIRALAEERGERIVFVAGADMAHVGPRFGDAEPYDEEQRHDLETVDRESLAHATSRSAAGFWGHVMKDNDTRRVCGLAPIYAMLKAMPKDAATHAETLHYEQTIDPDDGSIVSHASVAFYR